jgi:hypothetical protein
VGEQCVEVNIWTEDSEVTGDWRKLHKEKLNNVYFSPGKIKMVKSRRMDGQGILI